MISKVKTVIEIKSHAWVEHCMKVVGGRQAELARVDWYPYCIRVMGSEIENQERFEKVLNALTNKDTWSKWKAATIKPKPEAILAADLALPGTALTWDSGPEGLPLWAVLNRDEEVCEGFVNAELSDQVSRSVWWLLSSRQKPIGSMSISDKFQAMLEASIPENYWLKNPIEEAFPEDEEDPKHVDLRFANRDEFFLTAQELVKKESNALASAYAEGTKRYQNSKHSFGIAEYNILRKGRLLSFIALAVLCRQNKELSEIRSFIKNGIHQALIEKFGSDVADYVASQKYI